MPLYLGLDCSTQSLTVMALEVGPRPPRVVFEHAVEYDTDLPGYGTVHGVLPSTAPGVASLSPILWAEALDAALAAVARSGLDLSAIAAISGSAQQHGSVYLNDRATVRFSFLDPARALAGQLGDAFARPDAPVWMDSSTGIECDEISTALGGPLAVARLTGSDTFERFTGPQIRKFWKQQPEAWAETDRVHLVSSYLASLLVGAHAPLDPGDASGMNLMDLATGTWAPGAMAATAPDLERRLPGIVPSSTIIGSLAPYWQRRHGLPHARVAAWSGDNPSSLIGTGLVREGRLAVSLGTSDTVFGLMREPRVDDGGEGHVFGAPTGDFMGLTCFRNGSLARERIRDDHGLDWPGFDAALDATPAGNGGALLLPWFEPEITPAVPQAGAKRRELEPDDAARNVRAVVEGQMMALANHSRWMGVDAETIHATGGASASPAILQVMADVFDADVHRFESTNSACLGAALRAWHADAVTSDEPRSWDEIIEAVVIPMRSDAIRPRPEHAETYRRLRARYADFERAQRVAV